MLSKPKKIVKSIKQNKLKTLVIAVISLIAAYFVPGSENIVPTIIGLLL